MYILTSGIHADNLWGQGVATIHEQIAIEFGFVHYQFVTLALYVGLILGAFTWGILAEVVGLRLSFNATALLRLHLCGRSPGVMARIYRTIYYRFDCCAKWREKTRIWWGEGDTEDGQDKGGLSTMSNGISWSTTRPDLSHIKPLFSTPRLNYTMIALLLTWAALGLAYPLFSVWLLMLLSSHYDLAGSFSTYTSD